MPGASRWLDEKPSGTAITDAASTARASSSLRIASPPLGESEARSICESASRCNSLSGDLRFRITLARKKRRLAAVHVTLTGQTGWDVGNGQLQATRAFDL